MLIAVILAITMGCLFAARGWLRGAVVPAYIGLFEKNTVNRQFDENFAILQPAFGKAGVEFFDDNGGARCASDRYHFAGVSVNCYKTQLNSNMLVDQQQIDQWNQQAEQLQTTLEKHGWQIDRYSRPIALNQLFTSKEEVVSMSYRKEIDGTVCDLRILLINTENPAQRQVSLRCNKEIDFFGGSEY